MLCLPPTAPTFLHSCRDPFWSSPLSWTCYRGHAGLSAEHTATQSSDYTSSPLDSSSDRLLTPFKHDRSKNLPGNFQVVKTKNFKWSNVLESRHKHRETENWQIMQLIQQITSCSRTVNQLLSNTDDINNKKTDNIKKHSIIKNTHNLLEDYTISHLELSQSRARTLPASWNNRAQHQLWSDALTNKVNNL